MARNYIVLDTEGVDTTKHLDDQPHPETSLFYDLGFMVIDGDTGETLEEHSFINSDVFFNTDLMQSAYYANKRSIYLAGMGKDWQVADTLTIWRIFADACKRWGVRKVWAYNAKYDKNITNHTVREMSNGFQSYFTPYGVQWADIWDYAGSTLCNSKKYVSWCIAHEYVSAKGNPQTKAETVFRYLTEQLDFIEAHTALADCHIESAILWAAKKRKQKARHSMGHGWRDAARIAKEL